MAAVGARQLIHLVGVSPPVNVQKALLNQAVVPDRVELGCQEDSQQAADVHVRDLEGLGEGHHSRPSGWKLRRRASLTEQASDDMQRQLRFRALPSVLHGLPPCFASLVR